MAQSPHGDEFDRALAKIRTLNNPGSVHQFMDNVRLQSARGHLSPLQADAMRCGAPDFVDWRKLRVKTPMIH
jgi:hypothetical protein